MNIYQILPALGEIVITGSGIASEEAFGTLIIGVGTVFITGSGIISAENFGNATLTTGPVTITTLGIDSNETFGNPTVLNNQINIGPIGIDSSEIFGILQITTIEPPSPDKRPPRALYENDSDRDIGSFLREILGDRFFP